MLCKMKLDRSRKEFFPDKICVPLKLTSNFLSFTAMEQSKAKKKKIKKNENSPVPKNVPMYKCMSFDHRTYSTFPFMRMSAGD